ncbi:MAG: hypothetical protein RR235_09485 [Oscillospiraceae bacterium]
MAPTDIAFILIARYLGIEFEQSRIELRALLDIYVEAFHLENEEPQNAEPAPPSGPASDIPQAAVCAPDHSLSGDGEDAAAELLAPETETPSPASPDHPPQGKEPVMAFSSLPLPLAASGPGAALKKATHKRLLDYRAAHGLGCFIALAAAAPDRQLTKDIISAMLAGEPYPIKVWKALSEALDMAAEYDK